MKFAQAIRDFLSTLFGSKLVLQLRADLEETRKERDYFRGQFERMQLLAIPRSITPLGPRIREPQGATQVGTRKSWAQILAANTEAQNKIAAEKKPEKDSSEQTQKN